MALMRQINTEKKRAILAVASTILIIALLAAYAVFVNPELFKPNEVKITGTVTAPGVILNKIAFTNTGCGTRTEAVISSIEESSGTYAVSLDNEYSYNVSIAWNNSEGALVEAEIGTLVLDTLNQSLVRDWLVQP